VVKDAGRTGLAVAVDLTDPAFCRELVATTERELGGIGTLVNNAGKQQNVEKLADLRTPGPICAPLRTAVVSRPKSY
jgi:NAD(P)-dependent dehydrogenase (short-subunit alcohol dehydrogenase family)